jgi:NADH-quinone oxidoreductase subunit N
LFKLGAVPFHSWIPDVYTGAPTPVTAFMSVCTKIAAVGGLARLLYVAVGGLRWDWQLVLAVVAVLTMLVGALIGLAQTDVKRLLAYSSIAHAGFILVAVTGAVTATSGQVGSVAGALFYLAAYGFATLGAFAVVTLVRRAGGEATGLEAWGGIGRRNPLLGALMTVFLLSLAGIPLTGGFIGKVVAFVPAWTSGYQWLVVVAVLASLITAAFYFRVIGVMFFAPDGENVDVVTPGTSTWIVLAVGAVGTLALGLAPSWVLSLATQAANFLR